MRAMIVLGIVVLLVAAVLVWQLRRPWPKVAGEVTVSGVGAPVEILRDPWGVPHLYADSDHDLFFAQGYAHAQDRLWQMEMSRRVGWGLLSEILGPDTLFFDRFTRTVGLARAAAREWAALKRRAAEGESEARDALVAYSAGVNAYLESHRDRLALEFRLLGVDPEPWQPVDSLVLVKLMYWTLSENADFEISRARLLATAGEAAARELLPPYSEGAPVVLPPGVDGYSWLESAEGDPPVEGIYDQVAPLLGKPGPNQGSNGWAVAGSRTASGAPILANDTHLELFLPSVWYANGLHGGSFDVVGYSLAGVPAVVLGHNQHIAWGITDLVPDIEDLYQERLDGELSGEGPEPRQYLHRGEWKDLEIRHEEIPVKGAAAEPLVIRRTIHGPLLNTLGGRLAEGEPTSQAWTGDTGETVMQSALDLGRATNWQSFRRALSLWDGPHLNFVYADLEGNIGFQGTGRIPLRAEGHSGALPVPGWTGENDWQGWIPFEGLPRQYNPPIGYVVTANNKLVSDDYPYRLGYEWADAYRFLRISELLEENPRSTLEDHGVMQGDSHHLPAQALRPWLLAAAAESELERRAQEIVREWNLRADPQEVGAAVYQVWYRELIRELVRDELGEGLTEEYLEYYWVHGPVMVALMEAGTSPLIDDTTTPAVEDREAISTRALKAAVAWLEAELGPDPGEWHWGSLHTLTFRHRPLGLSGVPWLEKLFSAGPYPSPAGDRFTVNAGWFTVFDSDKPYAADAGAAQRILMDLDDWDRALGVNSTGQTEHLFHPHREDQVEMWLEQRFHPLLYTRAAVEAAVADGGHRLLLMPAETDSRNQGTEP
jgi:penicillin amidase